MTNTVPSAPLAGSGRRAAGGPYDRAEEYRRLGWTGTIPLDLGAKTPPPSGVTGERGRMPTADDILEWRTRGWMTRDDGKLVKHYAGNIALRLPPVALGLDVDDYDDKPGAATLADLEAKFGPLPPTWRSTSRDDGVSGIRYFRIPTGLNWPNVAGPGIEIIRHGHRYAVAPPSIHPESRVYFWLDPAGERCGFPAFSELPELPETWVAGLTGGVLAGEPSPNGILAADRADRRNGRAWLAQLPGGEPCPLVAERTAVALAAARRELGNAYDHTRDAVLSLLRGGETGHPGVPAGLAAIRQAYADTVQSTRGGRSIAEGEFDRLAEGGAALLLQQPGSTAGHGCNCARPAADGSNGHRDLSAPGVGPLPPGHAGDAAEPVTDEEDRAARFPKVDWDEAFATDFSHIDWLPGRFMERGQQVALVGDGKVGKSLLILYWIWCAVTGRSFLGDERRDPISVLYFDRENNLRDIVTRLTAFGGGPSDLKGLDYRLFPRFSGSLDGSPAAAAELLAIVDEQPRDVVVLDTVSRYIAGKENDSDTWLSLYRRIHAPLKARTVGSVRLDHMGKDTEKGARGSSAKTQDVDHVWELTQYDESRGYAANIEVITTRLKMHRTHTRSGLGEETFHLTRRGEKERGGMWLPGRTCHELTDQRSVQTENHEEEIIAALDLLRLHNAPTNLGRDKLAEWAGRRGISLPTTTKILAEITRRHKERNA